MTILMAALTGLGGFLLIQPTGALNCAVGIVLPVAAALFFGRTLDRVERKVGNIDARLCAIETKVGGGGVTPTPHVVEECA